MFNDYGISLRRRWQEAQLYLLDCEERLELALRGLQEEEFRAQEEFNQSMEADLGLL